MIIYEEEHRQLTQICGQLAHDARAKAIFVVDKDGQLVTDTGETPSTSTMSPSRWTSAPRVPTTVGFCVALSNSTRTQSTIASLPVAASAAIEVISPVP